MHQVEISPEILNAYVDGELTSAEAASVARAAADRPAIAARIATLREMKAAVADSIPGRRLKLLDQSSLPLGRIALAAVASIAIMAVTTTLYLNVWMEPAGTKWAGLLQFHHAAWSFPNRDAGANIVPARVFPRQQPLGLESARLTFTGYQQFEYSGRKIFRTGYEGTRGCHVSLYVFPADIALNEDGFSPSLQVHTWKIRQEAFVLMADGMASARFSGLAKAVEKALRSGTELDLLARQQLAHARQTSPPCRA